jgi:hypothetical protein
MFTEFREFSKTLRKEKLIPEFYLLHNTLDEKIQERASNFYCL